MLVDKRLEQLAKGLVNYSCNVQKGDKVLIEANGCDYQLVNLLIKEIVKAGGIPFFQLGDSRIQRELLMGMTEEQATLMAKYAGVRMKEMQAYIGIRGGQNAFELSDVPSEKLQIYSRLYSDPVHSDLRVKNTKWVVLRYPTEGMSELAGMSTEAYEDFYFNVCNLDYNKMSKAMDSLVELMDATDKVRLVAKGTDITFSIKGIKAIKCDGQRNIPDGEVYTAPVKDSINGVISYNVPSIENGIKFSDVVLEFKNGKIVNATANDTKALNDILDTDEGARYVGEFAIGVNPYINKAIGDILFDEKISGSIHFTPGKCYEDADNGNESAIHWDMVLVMTPEYGGGEIYFDDKLIRKDGLFVIDSLKSLNPENLK